MVTMSQLVSVGILFVILGIALSIGAEVTSEVEADVTATQAKHAIQNTTKGIAELASWQDTIALVIAAGVIISIVFSAFAFRSGRGL